MTDLDELERLLAKATEGPWSFGRGKSGLSVAAIAGKMKQVASSSWHSCSDHYPTERETVANFEAITALRNAAPAMIAELKALRRATAMSELIASTADEYGEVEACVSGWEVDEYGVQNNGTD